MLYGETDVKPLHIDIDTRIVTYWAKLVAPTYDKLSVLMYKSMLSRLMQINITNANSFKWICYVRTVLIKRGLVKIWDNQSFYSHLVWLKKTVSLKLSDLFINNWYSTINMSSKCKKI